MMKKKIISFVILISMMVSFLGMGLKVVIASANSETDFEFTFTFMADDDVTASAISSRTGANTLFRAYYHDPDDTENEVQNIYTGSLTVSGVSTSGYTVTGTADFTLSTDDVNEVNTILSSYGMDSISMSDMENALYLEYYDVVAGDWLSLYNQGYRYIYSSSMESITMVLARMHYGVIPKGGHEPVFSDTPNVTTESGTTAGSRFFLKQDYSSREIYSPIAESDEEWNSDVVRVVKNGVSTGDAENTLYTIIDTPCFIDIITGFTSVDEYYANWYELSYELSFNGDTIYFDEAAKVKRDLSYYHFSEEIEFKYPVGTVIKGYSSDGTKGIYYVSGITYYVHSGYSYTTTSTLPDTISEDYYAHLDLEPVSEYMEITAEVNEDYVNAEDHKTYTLSDTENMSVTASLADGADASSYVSTLVDDGKMYYHVIDSSVPVDLNLTVTYQKGTLSYMDTSRIYCFDGSTAPSSLTASYYTIEAGTLPSGITLDNLGLYPVSALYSGDSLSFISSHAIWVKGLGEDTSASFTINEKNSTESSREVLSNRVVFKDGCKGQTIINVSKKTQSDIKYHVYYYDSYDESFDSSSYKDHYLKDYAYYGMLGDECGCYEKEEDGTAVTYSKNTVVTLSYPTKNEYQKTLLYWMTPDGKKYTKDDVFKIASSDVILYGVWEKWEKILISYDSTDLDVLSTIEFGLSLSKTKYMSYQASYPDDSLYSLSVKDKMIEIHYSSNFTDSLYLFVKYNDKDFFYLYDVTSDMSESGYAFRVNKVDVECIEAVTDKGTVAGNITVSGNNAWYYSLCKEGTSIHAEEVVLTLDVPEGLMVDMDAFELDNGSSFTYNAEHTLFRINPVTDLSIKFTTTFAKYRLTYSFYDDKETAISDVKELTLKYMDDITENDTYYSKNTIFTASGTDYIIYDVTFEDEEGVAYDSSMGMPAKNLKVTVHASPKSDVFFDLSTLTLNNESVDDLSNYSFIISARNDYLKPVAASATYLSGTNLYYSVSQDFNTPEDTVYIWASPAYDHYAYIGRWYHDDSEAVVYNMFSVDVKFSEVMLETLTGISYESQGDRDDFTYEKPVSISSDPDVFLMRFYFSTVTSANYPFAFEYSTPREVIEAEDNVADDWVEFAEDNVSINYPEAGTPRAVTVSLSSQIKHYHIIYTIMDINYSLIDTSLLDDPNLDASADNHDVGCSFTQTVYYGEKVTPFFLKQTVVPKYFQSGDSYVGIGTMLVYSVEYESNSKYLSAGWVATENIDDCMVYLCSYDSAIYAQIFELDENGNYDSNQPVPLTYDNVVISSTKDTYTESDNIVYMDEYYCYCGHKTDDSPYYFYKSPCGDYIYLGDDSDLDITLLIAKVDITLSDLEIRSVIVDGESKILNSSKTSFYVSCSGEHAITLGIDKGYELDFEESDCITLASTSSSSIADSATKNIIKITDLNRALNLELKVSPKIYYVYYLKDKGSYQSFIDSYNADEGIFDESYLMEGVTTSDIMYDDDLILRAVNQKKTSGSTTYENVEWFDATTGKSLLYESMPYSNLFVYAHWMELGSVHVTVFLYDGVNEEEEESSLRLYRNTKDGYILVTKDEDGDYNLQYEGGDYLFTYGPTYPITDYSLWIKYPGNTEYEYFSALKDLGQSYTLHKFNNNPALSFAPFEITNGGWYEEGTVDITFKPLDESDDSYLGYTITDKDNLQNVIITRSEDGKTITLRIQNFAEANVEYNISSKQRPYYIFYFSQQGKKYSDLTQTYYYKDDVIPQGSSGLPLGNYVFNGWYMSDGTNLNTVLSMPANDIAVYARTSEYQIADITLTLRDGITSDMIFVSQSKDTVLTEGSTITYSGNTLHLEYKGSGYLWIHDPYSGTDKYLGDTVHDKMNYEFVLVSSNKLNHLTLNGIGYRFKDTTDSILVVPDTGYEYEVSGYTVNDDSIIFQSCKNDVVLSISEKQTDYVISYDVEGIIVHKDTYHYQDKVSMWVYDGALDFAYWNEELDFMPADNITIYGLLYADYEIVTMPTISKIHAGLTLKDAIITGGEMKADGIAIPGVFSFKDETIVLGKSDSLTTKYELLFTPSSKKRVPKSMLVTVEVCNPKYDVKNIASPTLTSRTDKSLTFTINSKYEYSVGNNLNFTQGTVYTQSSMKPGETITVYYRYKEDENYCTSDTLSIVFRTYTRDEYLYMQAQERGEVIISSYQRILDNEDIRALMAKYYSMLDTDYDDADMTGLEAEDLVSYMEIVLAAIEEIEAYQGNMEHLNSERAKNYSDLRCSEISSLAEEEVSSMLITNYKDFILSVFDSSDYMVGFYDVKDSDLWKKTKLTALEDTSMETESAYIVNKVDELMGYDFEEYSMIDVKDFQNSFVKNTVGLMNDSKKSIHESCPSYVNGTMDMVTSVIGKKVSDIQYMTYLDYKFDRTAYDEKFYLAAEAAVVAHIEGIVLQDIDSQYNLVLASTSDLSKQSLLKVVYNDMVIKYSDYDTFKAMYDEIIGTDGSVTYEDCLNLFHEQVTKTMVVPVNSGLTSVEIIILIGFASLVAVCFIVVIVKHEIKKRRYSYERR